MQYFIMYLLGDFHDIGIMHAGALRPCTSISLCDFDKCAKS